MRDFLRRVFLGRLAASGAGLALAGHAARPGRARAQGSGRVSGFDHVAAPMRDVEAMVGFYRKLGFHVNEGRGICSVHFGDHKINFHRPSVWQNPSVTLRAPAAEPPCGDFCFVWDGSEAALIAKLRDTGVAIIEGPIERTGGLKGGTARGISRYIRDPDGNLLEFIIY